MRTAWMLFALGLFGCSPSQPGRPDADSGSDTVDAAAEGGGPDAADVLDAVDTSDATDARSDAGGGCSRVTVGTFRLEHADDVSIAYETSTSPTIDQTFSRLQILFERYVPGPATGRFVLGPDGADVNYGSCQHCVVIPGAEPTFAYFADRGVLDLTADPYVRRLRGTIENLRLVEVSVNPETRESTPVANGRCIEVANVTVDQAFPDAVWTCPTERFADGSQCDCECGALDPDCIPCDPSDPACPAPLPVRDCASSDLCRQGLATGTTRCYARCEWGVTPCTTGQCIYDYGIYGASVCAVGEDEVSAVQVGEMCPPRDFMRPCGVVDGFARGYCGPTGICRPTCDLDEECLTVPGTVCQRFFTDRTLGYCEVPMSIE